MAQYNQSEITAKLSGVQPLHQNTGVDSTVSSIQNSLNVSCQEPAPVEQQVAYQPPAQFSLG